MRYRLRTLLILLAILPPLLWIGWTKYSAWRAEQERKLAQEDLWIDFPDGTRSRIYWSDDLRLMPPPQTVFPDEK